MKSLVYFTQILGATALLMLGAMPASAAAAVYAIAGALATEAPPIDGDLSHPQWQSATKLTLDWNFTLGQPAQETTTAYLLFDATYLYVGFDAQQKEPISATQGTNGAGRGSDDEVQLFLWPAGVNSFEYTFVATPRGTRYQLSTENSAYAPSWDAVAKPTPDGYAVTMRIPLKILRGDGRTAWNLQAGRKVQATQQTFEWAHDPAQNAVDSLSFVGSIKSPIVLRASRPTPRLALYGLGETAARIAGGSTSRMGADLSIPITATTSLFGTFHPDFSNVEKDQQTISPTAFRRFFSDVRPFFTQGSNFYNFANCWGCPGIQELYTPIIPTPKRGYAIEGTQGLFRFAGFDAVGDGRNDTAQSIFYSSPSRHTQGSYMRVSSDARGMHDVTDIWQIVPQDRRHWQAYLTYAQEHGSAITNPNQARRYDTGVSWFNKTDFYAFTARKVGAQYNPFDGIVQHNDVNGYSAQTNTHKDFGEKKPVTWVELHTFLERYQGTGFGPDQSQNYAEFDVHTKTDFLLQVNTGSQYVRFGQSDLYRPYNNNGITIMYHNNTATPSMLQYNQGRYNDGFLRSYARDTAFHLTKRSILALNADNTDWFGDRGTRVKQWLMRASISTQIGADESLAFGVRKIVGIGPPNSGLLGSYVNAPNISVAYSRRHRNDEMYLVYGDASAFVTAPQMIFKYVHYFGAEKGT